MDYLFYQPDAATGDHVLDRDEAVHCARVLRKKTGDLIYLTDGKGNLFTARLTLVSLSACRFEIVARNTAPQTYPFITVAVSPVKHPDRFEWLIEKCTEAGAHRIVPLLCQRTQKSQLRTTRLQRVAISAMKQSLRPYLPEIAEPIDFKEWINRTKEGMRYICTAAGMEPSGWIGQIAKATKLTVVIGPEGDFSEEELKIATSRGFEPISLGPYRLRTETAAIAATLFVSAFGAFNKPTLYADR